MVYYCGLLFVYVYFVVIFQSLLEVHIDIPYMKCLPRKKDSGESVKL